MDELAFVRKRMHERYLQEKKKEEDAKKKAWLEEFRQKHDFSDQAVASKLIRQYISNYLPEPVNMTPDELKLIPAIYRKRLVMSDQHKSKPISKPKTPPRSSSSISMGLGKELSHRKLDVPIPNIPDTNNDPYARSLMEYEQEIERQLAEAMSRSMGGTNTSGIVSGLTAGTGDPDLDRAIMESMQDQYMDTCSSGFDFDPIVTTEDDDLKRALELSMADLSPSSDPTPTPTPMSQYMDIGGLGEFDVLIDLRVYGPHPDKPVYVGAQEYYLDIQQRDLVTRLWKKVNPETSAGMIYQQDLELLQS